MMIAVIATAPFYAANLAAAGAFDEHLKACHDAAWTMDEFADIPNAGVSAYPGGTDGETYYAYWIVDWDNVQAAGKCIMPIKQPTVSSISDFTKR